MAKRKKIDDTFEEAAPAHGSDLDMDALKVVESEKEDNDNA